MVKRSNILDSQLDSVFHALSDTTRRSILRDVASEEKTVSQIAEPYRVSLAAVSKHLKVLEGAGLIHREKRGSFQFIKVNAIPMKEAERWLIYYENLWNERFDRLGEHLKKLQSKETNRDDRQ
ncbi:MAG: ArsR/SmtB family transcription factor [Phycisphaerales bacterium]